MRKYILINASNLHNGGGVQVAISFLYEITLLELDLSRFHVIASSEVAEGLSRLNANVSKFGDYNIVDSFGIKALYSQTNKIIKNYKTVFTIFGPNYLRVKSQNEIVGFAQPWIINFDNPISRRMKPLKRLKLFSKFNLQWLFFLRSDHYVVELEHVKDKLISLKGVDANKISIIHNTVSSLYHDKSKWKPVSIQKSNEAISLGFLTRDYPHKNLDILPAVAEVLQLHHNLSVRFYTTLNDFEWASKDAFFKKYVSSVGALAPDQCPCFYDQLDGVIFPSLLECFSATPLEAMAMEKPLFASDRGFVRDVCGNHATYFNPLDADDIATKIAEFYKSDKVDANNLREARNHALSFSTAKDRAEKYLEIIHKHL
ncbi:glycosyltransferase [Psychrobacter pulmonis]